MTNTNKSTKNQGIRLLELAIQPYVDKSKDIIGEKALWQSVVMQAVLDSISNAKDTKSRVLRAKAIAWFSTKNQDFITVCSFAGMDPDFVIKGFKYALQQNKKTTLKRNTKNYKRLKKTVKKPAVIKIKKLNAGR